MSVRELRIALREARETVKSKDGVLSNKNKKLDEMEGKLETMSRKLVEKEQRVAIEKQDIERDGQMLRNEVTGILASIETNGILNQLQKGFDALQAHTERTGIDHGAFMAGCLNQIKRALVQVQVEYNLYLEDDTPSPYWSSDEAALAAESAIAELNLDWDKIEGTSNAETEH
jgi:predicted phage tail protein